MATDIANIMGCGWAKGSQVQLQHQKSKQTIYLLDILEDKSQGIWNQDAQTLILAPNCDPGQKAIFWAPQL